jgi:hypothetical protein
VPGDPSKPFEHAELEMAARTWTGEWWKWGGGGTVWDAMAYDPEADILYVGTGNGGPWNQNIRSPQGGDNLFLASIIAVKPGTGRMVWYFQEVPGETWDFTSTQPIILADLMLDGEERKVLMHAPRTITSTCWTASPEGSSPAALRQASDVVDGSRQEWPLCGHAAGSHGSIPGGLGSVHADPTWLSFPRSDAGLGRSVKRAALRTSPSPSPKKVVFWLLLRLSNPGGVHVMDSASARRYSPVAHERGEVFRPR